MIDAITKRFRPSRQNPRQGKLAADDQTPALQKSKETRPAKPVGAGKGWEESGEDVI